MKLRKTNNICKNCNEAFIGNARKKYCNICRVKRERKNISYFGCKVKAPIKHEDVKLDIKCNHRFDNYVNYENCMIYTCLLCKGTRAILKDNEV